jgi:hypothetical protein
MNLARCIDHLERMVEANARAAVSQFEFQQWVEAV